MLVRVANPQFLRKDVWFFTQPEYFEYTGLEVKLKHVGPDELALTTGDSEWPVRVIQRKWILSIDGVATEPIASSRTLTRTVQGSKGEVYVVTVSGNSASCTCSGFQFRRSCKHIKDLV